MQIYIEQGGYNTPAKQIAGWNTYVYVIDDNGNKVDISPMVREADLRLHVGEAVTAKLEVYVTGFKGRAELEKLIVKKKPWWRRRPWEITGFRNDGARTFV